MSWLQSIQNDLIIQTGDGKKYTVGWIPTNFSVDYNVSEFNFPGKRGTLVYRSEVKGTRHNIEIHFSGEDCIDNAAAFRESANDKRMWKISHPFYGALNVQPISLFFDDKDYNVTKITGTVVETITDSLPKTSNDPIDKIIFDKARTDQFFAQSFATNVIPDTGTIGELTKANTDLYNLGAKRVKLTVDAEAYFNAFNDANASILNATAEPLAAVRQLQAVINMPAQFAESVQNRIDTLVNQVDVLRQSIATISSPEGKRIFELNVAGLVSGMAYASATPQDGNYETRSDVYRVVETILSVYNQYVADLDEMQTDNGGNPDSYIPDGDSLLELNKLINYTLSNLFAIAIDSKQERAVILEDDSNPILLTHRFYGLDMDDANLDKFIRTNNLGIDQVLKIRKGTKIVYYI